MNAHQRRKFRRLYERVFGSHVDYSMFIRLDDEDDTHGRNAEVSADMEAAARRFIDSLNTENKES